MNESSTSRRKRKFDVVRLWVGSVRSGAPTHFEFDVYRHWCQVPDEAGVFELEANDGEGWISYHADIPASRTDECSVSGPYCEAQSELFDDDYAESRWCDLDEFDEEVRRLARRVRRARKAEASVGLPRTLAELVRALAALPHLRFLHLPRTLEDDGWDVFAAAQIDDALVQLEALVEEHFAMQAGETPDAPESLELLRERPLPVGVTVELRDRIREDARAWIEENSRPFVPSAGATGLPAFAWQLDVPAHDVVAVLEGDPLLARIGSSAFTVHDRYGGEVAYATEVLVDVLSECGEPQTFEWASAALRRRLSYPSPDWDLADSRLVDYRCGYLGLSEWGDDGRARVLTRPGVISDVLRFGVGRATFGELCLRFGVSETGLLADVLWASVQQLKLTSLDVVVQPDEQRPDALVAIRDFVPYRRDWSGF